MARSTSTPPADGQTDDTADVTVSDSGVDVAPEAPAFEAVNYAKGDDKRVATSQAAAYVLEFDGFQAAKSKS